MDEDNAIRAIIIGAGLLISMAVISGVLIYFNVARGIAQRARTGVDYNVRYRQDIEASLMKTSVTGTELKNIINYFYDDKFVTINISSMSVVGSANKVKYDEINKTTSNYNKLSVLESIRPKYTFDVTKTTSGQYITYSYKGTDKGA